MKRNLGVNTLKHINDKATVWIKSVSMPHPQTNQNSGDFICRPMWLLVLCELANQIGALLTETLVVMAEDKYINKLHTNLIL